MLPDRVSNPRLLTYESGALPIALRDPAKSALHNVASDHGLHCLQTKCTIKNRIKVTQKI